jgi:hypothetical protein
MLAWYLVGLFALVIMLFERKEKVIPDFSGSILIITAVVLFFAFAA